MTLGPWSRRTPRSSIDTRELCPEHLWVDYFPPGGHPPLGRVNPVWRNIKIDGALNCSRMCMCMEFVIQVLKQKKAHVSFLLGWYEFSESIQLSQTSHAAPCGTNVSESTPIVRFESQHNERKAYEDQFLPLSQESPQQTKPKKRKGQNEKFMSFAHFCEFWCFSLGEQARFTLNFCSGMPL